MLPEIPVLTETHHVVGYSNKFKFVATLFNEVVAIPHSECPTVEEVPAYKNYGVLLSADNSRTLVTTNEGIENEMFYPSKALVVVPSHKKFAKLNGKLYPIALENYFVEVTEVEPIGKVSLHKLPKKIHLFLLMMKANRCVLNYSTEEWYIYDTQLAVYISENFLNKN